MIETAMLTPDGVPTWASDPEKLWNAVESAEHRVDAQLAREFILSVPVELSAREQFDLAAEWAKRHLVSQGMTVYLCLHHSKDGANPHCHLLCTLRRFDGDSLAAKKAREWNDKQLLVAQRESWADAENAALERAGRPERVDHRSLKARGIERIAEPKLGVEAVAMKRRGADPDPKRFQNLRFVKMVNEMMPQMRTIQRMEEAKQPAPHHWRWWEKSLEVVSRAAQAAQESVMEAWEKLSTRMRLPWGSHEHPAHQPAPARERDGHGR